MEMHGDLVDVFSSLDSILKRRANIFLNTQKHATAYSGFCWTARKIGRSIYDSERILVGKIFEYI